MKVVFLQDVPKLGKAGEIKEVADGYGRNFLIPRKLALPATPKIVNTIEEQLKVNARLEAETEAELLELANQLEGKEVTLKAKVGGKERLYGAITGADIATELEKTLGVAVDKRKIELTEPIHKLGSYEVAIRLAKDKVPNIKVTIVKEEAE